VGKLLPRKTKGKECSEVQSVAYPPPPSTSQTQGERQLI
jgi:hypothetical protein